MKKCLVILAILFTTQAHSLTEQRATQMKKFYDGKNVLVTGGCGFIGSHLSEKLVALGAHVTIIDNLETGNADNIATFKDSVTFIEKSIIDNDACLQVTRNQDVIFHLAAFISVPESIEKPQECYQTNVQGTTNLLEAAHINNVPRFVFSSSAAIYGNHEGTCTENTPCAPTSPYGYSKRIGELLCMQYAQNFGLHTVMLRYFNVWGERQNPNGSYAAVVAKFSHQIEHDLPITIFGDGTQTRDFVPVSKVVEANLILGMLANTQQVHGNIFNVATGSSINLLELIDQLKEKHPSYASEIRFAPARAGDVHDSAADCSKYQEITA